MNPGDDPGSEVENGVITPYDSLELGASDASCSLTAVPTQEEETMRPVSVITLGVALGAALAAHAVLAQSPPMQHHPMHGMQHGTSTPGAPAMPGQDAFGAIAEVVKLLDADPSTDWSKVDLERLRQHLIDMNEVVLRSRVKQAPVAGGLEMDVTGTGRTEQAIRAMVVPHAAELDRMSSYAAKTAPIPGGVRLTVTARTPGDEKAVARVRGLGFIGLLTAGAHHGPHHLAMARGETLVHTH